MFAGDVAPKSRTHKPSSDPKCRDNSPSPLERRVSRAGLAGTGVWPAPVDEPPRKIFMNFAFWITCLVYRGRVTEAGYFFCSALTVCPLELVLPELAAAVVTDCAAAGACHCASGFTSNFLASLLMSTLPFKYAPSSTATPWVTMSPIITAELRSSTRSVACTSPSSLPCTNTPLAVIFACTCPLGPIVILCPRSSIVPSTRPSRYKSSLPESSPLITTDFPMCASSLVFGLSIVTASLEQTNQVKTAKPLLILIFIADSTLVLPRHRA